MVMVHEPFIGYRVRPEYARLLPTCEGRPELYSLSPLYLAPEIEGYDEARQFLYNFESAEKTYPGGHTIF